MQPENRKEEKGFALPLFYILYYIFLNLFSAQIFCSISYRFYKLYSSFFLLSITCFFIVFIFGLHFKV
jgi:hypothetical protein